MTRAKNTLLTYIILILLAAAIIASGKFLNSLKSAPPEKDYATKLAELRSDLTKAAKTGNKQHTSKNKRTTSRKSPKTGST